MLQSIDNSLFLFFNDTLSNPVFDVVMPFITDSDHILYTLLTAYVLYIIFGKNKKQALLFIALAFIVFGLTDAIAYRIIKPLVGRVRPCHPKYFVDGVHMFLQGGHFLQGYKDTLSFPSNHAGNAIGLATFWALCFPKKWFWFVIPGILVAYSRIYVGVHYPFDVLGGTVLGLACASAVFFSYRGIKIKIELKKSAKVEKQDSEETEVTADSQ